VFDNPTAVFTEDILKPELQGPAVFADGVANIVEARRLGIPARFEHARGELERVRAPEYLWALVGTIGTDPVHRPLRGRPSRTGAPDARETRVKAVAE
jgi:hypothetical protein